MKNIAHSLAQYVHALPYDMPQALWSKLTDEQQAGIIDFLNAGLRDLFDDAYENKTPSLKIPYNRCQQMKCFQTQL